MQYAVWRPDALDASMLPLPAEAVAAAPPSLRRGRHSSRDLEEFTPEEIESLTRAHELSVTLKCRCDGGGQLGAYIGAPPNHGPHH